MISNFTDEDHIRVVPQNGSKRLGKSQSNLGMHLNLVDPIELVLDWIFGRDDLGVRAIDSKQ